MNRSNLAIQLVQHYGYIGLALCLIANCLGIPVSAEVLLPLSGALVRLGSFNFILVATVATIAQVAGLTIAYVIARQGGIKLLERYGHYVFINHGQLQRLHRMFRRHGFRIVFAGLYLPGVHGYMGYVAGLGRMRFPTFLLLVVTSNIIWTVALIGLGAALSSHLNNLTQILNTLGIAAVVVALLATTTFWYHRHHAS